MEVTLGGRREARHRKWLVKCGDGMLWRRSARQQRAHNQTQTQLDRRSAQASYVKRGCNIARHGPVNFACVHRKHTSFAGTSLRAPQYPDRPDDRRSIVRLVF